MFSEEMVNIFIRVIKSWQVIAVTITILIYISLVKYVTRAHRRPRFVTNFKPRKAKPAPAPKPVKKPLPPAGGKSNDIIEDDEE